MNKKKTFTLIEIIVSVSILIIVLAGIFLIFNFGQSQTPFDIAGIDNVARSRVIVTRLVNDLRGAVVWDIANNNPSCSYLKFRKLQGIDTDDGSYQFLPEYIEYAYDWENNTLSRSELDGGGVILRKVDFENISQDVFYTLNSENEQVCLNEDDLRSQGLIIAEITVEDPKNPERVQTAFLNQKIKIRNE